MEYVHIWPAESVIGRYFIKEELQIFAETSLFCVRFFAHSLGPHEVNAGIGTWYRPL
jgi:hypothetical protein